ncbi:nodulation protein NolB [Mesorhizobium sp. ArgA1]
MMVPVTLISASPTGLLPTVASPSLGERAQFERALAQAAASTKNNTASGPARMMPVPPHLDVQRTTAQASPRGDRVFQMISSITSAARDHEAGLEKGALPGQAQKLPVEGGAAGAQTGLDFGSMIAGLRDLYDGVTQVSLVSKGVSGFTSSVNTLIKQG